MIIACPSCATRFRVDTAVIPLAGRSVQCSRCSAVWRVGGAVVSSSPSAPPPRDAAEPGMPGDGGAFTPLSLRASAEDHHSGREGQKPPPGFAAASGEGRSARDSAGLRQKAPTLPTENDMSRHVRLDERRNGQLMFWVLVTIALATAAAAGFIYQEQIANWVVAQGWNWPFRPVR